MKNFLFGFATAIFMIVALNGAFTPASAKECVTYIVRYKAVVNDTFHGATRETVSTEEYVLPASQPVSEDFFRRYITTELSDYLEGELAPAQIHVTVLEISQDPLSSTSPA